TNDDVIPDFYSKQDDAAHANKYIIADFDFSVAISSAKQWTTAVMRNKFHSQRYSNIISNLNKVGLCAEVPCIDIAIFTNFYAYISSIFFCSSQLNNEGMFYFFEQGNNFSHNLYTLNPT